MVSAETRCLAGRRRGVVPSYAVVKPVGTQAFLSFAEAEICHEGDPAGAGQSEGFSLVSAGSKCALNSESTSGWTRSIQTEGMCLKLRRNYQVLEMLRVGPSAESRR